MTEGLSPDPDGFAVTIDSGAHQGIGHTDTLDMLVPGNTEHLVELADIAGNCSLGDSALTVVSGEDTTKVEFQVTCRPEAGVLRVTTVTTGTDVDPNGYTVTVDGVPYGAIDVSGDYSVSISTGAHTVTLAGVTHNCHWPSSDGSTSTYVGRGTTQVAFSLTCDPAAPAGPGREIAFVSDRLPDESQGVMERIHLMNDDGTGVRALRGVPNSRHRGLSWLPDGDQLGFIAHPRNPDLFRRTEVNILEIASGDFRTQGTGPYLDAQWSPDGFRLAYTEDLDPSGLGEEAPLQVFVVNADYTGNLQVGPRDASRRSPTWAPDGTRLAFVRPRSDGDEIAIRTIGGNDEALVPVQLPAEIDIDGLTWSPEGSRLAFHAILADNKSYVYVVNVDGTGPARLTNGRGRRGDQNPTWSPDGTKLAFASDRDGNFEIYLMDADGSEQTRLTNDPAEDTEPAWRP